MTTNGGSKARNDYPRRRTRLDARCDVAAVRTKMTVYVDREFRYSILLATLVLFVAASPAQAQSQYVTPVVDQATLQRLSARLEAAEAEIRSLRRDVAADVSRDPPKIRAVLRLPRVDSPPPADERSFFDPPEFVARFEGSGIAVSPAGDCDACGGACQRNGGSYGAGYLPPCCTRPGEISFKPGLRLQSRYLYNDINNNNDFFIRRFRMKGSGQAFDVAKYGAELKIDSSERFGVGNPRPIVENAWLDFTLLESTAYLKVGLYDIPFSRNALTSDSKLLFMDRTLIKFALTTIGMADNTVGVMVHGRPFGGYFEYSLGGFDNIRFDRTGKNSNQFMPAGRIAWYLLDPATGGSTSALSDGYADYRESYLGQGRRLVVGANFATLSNVIQGASEFDVHAWGVDVLFNSGPFVVQAEYDWFIENGLGGNLDLRGDGWYVQGGYLFDSCWELAARYQSLDDPINLVAASGQVEWTSIGLNYYIHEHNLKIQTNYIWKNEYATEVDNDVYQLQLQLDF